MYVMPGGRAELGDHIVFPFSGGILTCQSSVREKATCALLGKLLEHKAHHGKRMNP
jgi:hypothetical protein